MGQLLYGSPPEVFELDDRALAHLQIVTIAKLRRSESFAFTVDGAKGAQSMVWISPSSTLQFRLSSAVNQINRTWLDQLVEAANSASGLKVLPEPA